MEVGIRIGNVYINRRARCGPLSVHASLPFPSRHAADRDTDAKTLSLATNDEEPANVGTAAWRTARDVIYVRSLTGLHPKLFRKGLCVLPSNFPIHYSESRYIWLSV
jgi:hypothetical protein